MSRVFGARMRAVRIAFVGALVAGTVGVFSLGGAPAASAAPICISLKPLLNVVIAITPDRVNDRCG
jgi:hypothetical protein